MNNSLKAFIYVIVFALAWALNVVIAKYAFNTGAEVYTYGAHTLIFSALIMFGYILLLKRKSGSLKYEKNDIWLMLFFGIIANGIGNLAGIKGLDISSASNYGFLIKTSVVFVIILGYLFLKEKIDAKKIVFTIILLVGAYMISTAGQTIVPKWGDLLIIFSAFCFAFVTVFSKKINIRNSPEYLSLYRGLAGGIFLFFTSIVIGEDIFRTDFLHLSLAGAVCVFVLFLFFYKALELQTASYVTMLGLLFSVFVAVFSLILLGEKLNYVQIIGGALILASVILIEKTSGKGNF